MAFSSNQREQYQYYWRENATGAHACAVQELKGGVADLVEMGGTAEGRSASPFRRFPWHKRTLVYIGGDVECIPRMVDGRSGPEEVGEESREGQGNASGDMPRLMALSEGDRIGLDNWSTLDR